MRHLTLTRRDAIEWLLYKMPKAYEPATRRAYEAMTLERLQQEYNIVMGRLFTKPCDFKVIPGEHRLWPEEPAAASADPQDAKEG